MLKLGSKIGDYILKRKIGRGSFGVVWLAEKQGLISTEFALKVPNEFDVDLALVEREAVLWRKASGHPNVLPIIEAKIYDEQVVIVSEYVSGGTLQELIDKLKADCQILDIEKSLELISGILNGLQHLHSNNIIHQDLKPANILLQGETPRLTDFGISGTLSSKSYVSGTLGTYPYMSPETFKGKRSIQTDIWAVGVIFYQLLSGNLPFPQEDSPSVMNAVINDNVPPLPESIPKLLRSIVEKALQKNIELRYKTASEMRQAVRESQFPVLPLPTEPSTPLIIETLPMPPPDIPRPLPTKKKTEVWLWGVIGIGLVFLSAVILLPFIFHINKSTYKTTQSNSQNLDLILQSEKVKLVPFRKGSKQGEDKFGYCDLNKKIIIEPKFDCAEQFDDSGKATICVGEKEGLIDLSGDFVLPAKFDGIGTGSKDGNLFLIMINRKYGYVDKNANEVIPLKYDYAKQFSEGLAAVRINSKWGYIDEKGNEIIQLKFSAASDFVDGIASVRNDHKTGRIDKLGNQVTPFIYDDIGNTSEGLTSVSINGKWGYIDKDGIQVISCQFDEVTFFSNGLAVVFEKGKPMLIDKLGNIVNKLEKLKKYKFIKNFSEGFFFASNDDKNYGLIDLEGEKHSRFKYGYPNGGFNELIRVRNGLAKVPSDYGFIYIDTNGTEYYEP